MCVRESQQASPQRASSALVARSSSPASSTSTPTLKLINILIISATPTLPPNPELSPHIPPQPHRGWPSKHTWQRCRKLHVSVCVMGTQCMYACTYECMLCICTCVCVCVHTFWVLIMLKINRAKRSDDAPRQWQRWTGTNREREWAERERNQKHFKLDFGVFAAK